MYSCSVSTVARRRGLLLAPNVAFSLGGNLLYRTHDLYVAISILADCESEFGSRTLVFDMFYSYTGSCILPTHLQHRNVDLEAMGGIHCISIAQSFFATI